MNRTVMNRIEPCRIGCANAMKIASFLILRILLIRQENESEKWCDSSHPTRWEKDR